MTPVLPDDLFVLSRPTTYVTCSVKSNDGNKHTVQFYFSANGELAQNNGDHPVNFEFVNFDNSMALKVGSKKSANIGQSR